MKSPARWIVALVVGAFAAFLTYRHVSKVPELSRTEFLLEVVQGHVHSVTVEDEEVIVGESSTRGAFRTSYRKAEDSDLADELRARGVQVVFEKSTPGLI